MRTVTTGSSSPAQTGVDAFFEMFFKLYDDAREIGGAKIAAIGPATAQRVKDFHLHVDLQPEEFVAEAVVREFQKVGGVENLRIFAGPGRKGAGRAFQRTFEAGRHCGRSFCLSDRNRKRVILQAGAVVLSKRVRT